MDFSLTEEQGMLRASARDFLEEKCPKSLVKEMETDEQGYPPSLWKEMADLGWLGLVFPEEYDGSGMNFLDLAVLLEETGRACLPGPFFSSVVLGGLTILDAGTDAQKKTYLPDIASGESIATMAITEPDGLYSPGSIKTRAESTGNDFSIKGQKLFVPDAHVADKLLCVARTGEGSADTEGITIFLIDNPSEGMSHTVLKTISGDKLCEVVLDGVKVPADRIIGSLDQGWPVVQRVIERAAVAKCCEMLGVMDRALEMTVSYAGERKQFGRPIGSFQIIQHYCANMASDIDGARFSTYQAAWKISKGLPATMEVSIAKAWMNEAFSRVITTAHQINGAMGCTIDHELQYYTRRGKAGDLSYGDGDFHRELVAQQMGL
jgi:alkylation response protein AidB-like acyl-CoA dehydrogenase